MFFYDFISLSNRHNYALEFLMKVENKEEISETDSIFDFRMQVE